jgi:hypothetical protein
MPRKLPDWMGMKDALDTVVDTSSGPPPHAQETKGKTENSKLIISIFLQRL